VNFWSWGKYALCITGTAAMLAGCGGGSSSALAPTGAANPASMQSPLAHMQGTLGTAHSAGVTVRPDRGPSWMSPASSSSDLLYISDAGTNDVYVYSYPDLKLTGTLTGFHEPQGECSDANGDVYITNTDKRTIIEYAHGSSKRSKLLRDDGGYPLGCAIDPTTGNLAVTNIYDQPGPGEVVIYKNAIGKPKTYYISSEYFYYFDAYDSSGNLYVSGRGPKGGTFELSMLPSGGSSLEAMTLNGGTIYFPGTVAWVGGSLILGDQSCNDANTSCLYEASVSGTTATITGSTSLTDSCDVVEAWVTSSIVAAGNYNYCGSSSNVDLWAFPAGGAPTKTASGVTEPIGATISSAGS